MSIKKAEPVISLPRRIWRWWQVPIAAWSMLLFNERPDENKVIPSLFTVPGVFAVSGIMLYIIVTELINWKKESRIGNEPPEWFKKMFENHGWDKIQFRTIDSFRFWHHYAGTCKVLGRKQEASAANKKAQELREELMIIRLAKI